MTPTSLRPGICVEEVASSTPALSGVATSITAFIGWTPRGPTDHAEPISCWSDYDRTFGGLDANSLVSYAVHYFFVNGGKQAYVIRLARTIDDDPKSKVGLTNRLTGVRAKGRMAPVFDSEQSGSIIRPNTPSFTEKLRAALPLLDDVDLFNLLCVPGETEDDVIRDLQDYCYGHRAFLIADCRETDTYQTLTDKGIADIVMDRSSANAAYYFPWVKVYDPRNLKTDIMLPPSGFIAGIISMVDSERGVWKAPAGVNAKLVGAVGLKEDIDDRQYDGLNAKGIDCLRNFNHDGTVVWGARTLLGGDGGSEWKYIPVRRTALFIEESLYRGTKWVAFEPNNELLWSKVRSSVEAFMTGLFRRGAFQGRTLQEAFFVKCDKETTTQGDIDGKIINIQVGFAPLKPAEFVVIRIRQSAK